MAPSKTILHLGSTGFIGGDVLFHLLQSPLTGTNRIIAPVSDEEKAHAVRTWTKEHNLTFSGLEVPVVSRQPENQWYAKVEEWAEEVDCAINAATSDDIELTKAINRGLETGKKKLGKRGTLVHLSGVQLIESEPIGKYVETPLYDDSDTKSIASIPDSAAHRSIDLEIVNAVAINKVWGSIVCPALVWGKGSGPIQQTSAMIPDMVRKSVHNGFATYVGEGTNQWVHISIQDCADLIVRLVERHLSQPNPFKGLEPHSTFYFASKNDELVEFKDIARVIGKVLNEKGLIASPQPKAVPCPPFDSNMKGVRIEDDARSQADVEVESRTPIWPCRSNCRCIAKRGEAEVGWKPRDKYDETAKVKDIEACLA